MIARYAALGLKSLGEHARPVAQALRLGDLRLARERVGYMVSRNTADLDKSPCCPFRYRGSGFEYRWMTTLHNALPPRRPAGR